MKINKINKINENQFAPMVMILVGISCFIFFRNQPSKMIFFYLRAVALFSENDFSPLLPSLLWQNIALGVGFVADLVVKSSMEAGISKQTGIKRVIELKVELFFTALS